MKEMVLVSGGAGYIGSHTAVELINAGVPDMSICHSSTLKVPTSSPKSIWKFTLPVMMNW